MFKDIKVGDKVTRMLAESIPMELVVTEVTDRKIITGGGWEFSRITGGEIDEELGWDGRFRTGSRLVK